MTRLVQWMAFVLTDTLAFRLPNNQSIRNLDDYFAWTNTATPNDVLNQAIVTAANPMGLLGIVIFVSCLRAVRDDLGRKTVIFFFLLWAAGYGACVYFSFMPAYFGAISGGIAVVMFVMSKVQTVVDR